MKACMDCRHCMPDTSFNTLFGSLTTHSWRHATCAVNMRNCTTNRLSEEHFGRDGKWFEEKK